MKGTIFTVFLEMVEEKWDLSMTDKIIQEAKDPYQGAYTSVEYYDHSSLVQLIVALHKETNIPLRELLIEFGKYLFVALASSHPSLIEGIPTSFDLLAGIETLIHTEVRKLYPEAQTPHFECERLSETQMKMIYTSHRHMADLAEGLIQGCAAHYGEVFDIQSHEQHNASKSVEFLLTKVG